MDSRSSTVVAGAGAGGRDKLSRLSDNTLGHILSFLPATEAARTATLSRRWRHVFAAVHTLSFAEAEGPFQMGYEYWRGCGSCGGNDEARAPRFVPGVTTALNGRHRGSRAATVPLRALRIAFDEHGFRGGDETTNAVDGWLSYAVYGAGEALDIDLRLGTEPICRWPYVLVHGGPCYAAEHEVGYRHDATDMDMDGDTAEGVDDDDAADDDGGSATINDDYSSSADYSAATAVAAAAAAAESTAAASGDYNVPDPMVYVMPRSLFSSCAVLRALRLGRCMIDLPSAIALPSLDTLHLTRVTSRRGTTTTAIQRLVSACPSLADLTLEACEDLTELSLHGARLRRLALRCCHELATVAVATPELLAFEYRGAIPPESLLTMHEHDAAAPRNISFCAFDFCGGETGGELLGRTPTKLLAGVERLHLTSARLGSCFPYRYRHGGGASLSPSLSMLRDLKITGMLPDDDESAVARVAGILQRTPRLETLSLFFLPEPHPDENNSHYPTTVRQDVLDASHELRYDPHARLAALPRDVEIPCCLRETTKEINLVHYQGSVAQRALAKFLLGNAAVVDEVCWKVARGPLSIQMRLMEEVRGWVMNKSANVLFI